MAWSAMVGSLLMKGSFKGESSWAYVIWLFYSFFIFMTIAGTWVILLKNRGEMCCGMSGFGEIRSGDSPVRQG
jgi:hypothetical protein